LFQGVFWDIENCQVPRFKSAMALVELIRRKFLVKFREAEFVVVCDTHKERKEVITELNNAQVIYYHFYSHPILEIWNIVTRSSN